MLLGARRHDHHLLGQRRVRRDFVSQTESKLKQNRVSGAFLVSGALLLAYPVICGWLARSEGPRWFGKYSSFLLCFNLLGLMAVVWAFHQMVRPAMLPCFAWFTGLALLSVLPFGNNQLGALPGMAVAMWLARAVAAVGLVWLAFVNRREGQLARGVLATGVLLALMCLSDFVLFCVARSRSTETVSAGPHYRYRYNLSAVRHTDIILVGDSFVWGQGVDSGKEFGSRLQALLPEGTRVFMLGEIGTGLPQYVQSLKAIQAKVRRIIVCYCHNDMPAPESVVDRAQMMCSVVGHGVPSLRFMGDMIAKALTPTPEHYLRKLVANYESQTATYHRRCEQLHALLQQCFEEARTRSVEPPTLCILPGLLDFERYPFAIGHALVERTARAVGFEVFDPVEAFRASGAHERELWAAQNDPHFNELANEILAKFLWTKLAAATAIE